MLQLRLTVLRLKIREFTYTFGRETVDERFIIVSMCASSCLAMKAKSATTITPAISMA